MGTAIAVEAPCWEGVVPFSLMTQKRMRKDFILLLSVAA